MLISKYEELRHIVLIRQAVSVTKISNAKFLSENVETVDVHCRDCRDCRDCKDCRDCWDCWDCRDCIYWGSEKSMTHLLTYLLTYSVTTWKQEMLAHLKTVPGFELICCEFIAFLASVYLSKYDWNMTNSNNKVVFCLAGWSGWPRGYCTDPSLGNAGAR